MRGMPALVGAAALLGEAIEGEITFFSATLAVAALCVELVAAHWARRTAVEVARTESVAKVLAALATRNAEESGEP